MRCVKTHTDGRVKIPTDTEVNDLMDFGRQEEFYALTARVVEYARDQIMVSLRFLNRALFRMPQVATDTVVSIATDTNKVYYNPKYVAEAFKKERNLPSRIYLHMILHCIFSHPFQYEKMDRECWDFACDAAVEKCILDLDIKDTALDSDEELRKCLRILEADIPELTAERIYRFLLDNPGAADRYLEMAPQFERDDHARWFKPSEHESRSRGDDRMTNEIRTAMVGCHEADTGAEGTVEDLDEVLIGRGQSEWEEISQHAKTDLETFSREKGYGAGSLLLNLRECLKEKYDYEAFLRRFAVMGEEIHVNDDEFDYVYYTYGLELYENMPLIEPLEYRENKKIRDFAVAIDTSGSCQGTTVELFLRKTYNILKTTGSYFEQVNIHIIQCDEKIQRDKKITSDAEFEQYMEDVELAGFGGTDFRPVFEYVDGMIERREFTDLKGLIYFTDGHGTFPEKMPGYETAFIFVDEGYDIPQVPQWAIKLILSRDDIETM